MGKKKEEVQTPDSDAPIGDAPADEESSGEGHECVFVAPLGSSRPRCEECGALPG